MRPAAAATLAAVFLLPGLTAADGRGPARSSATPGAAYGGGDLPGDYRNRHTRTLLLSFLVTGDGGRASVVVFPSARCGTRAFATTVSLAPDGSFSAQGVSRRLPGGGGRLRSSIRYRLAGRLDGQGGSGRLDARLTFRPRGERADSCSTGFDWQVRTGGAPAATGPPIAGAEYYGITSQRVNGQPAPFALRVASNGRRVAQASALIRHRCRVAVAEPFNGYHFPSATLGADGGFRSRERYAQRYSNARERFVATAGGRIAGPTATGTLSVRSVVRFRNGRTGRCRTGRVAWNAAA